MIRTTCLVSIRCVCVFCVTVSLACVAGSQAADVPGQGEAGELASQILKATGVKGGVIVHLGCGDGKLTAALRAGDAFLVQGLEPDAGNVAAAREHVRSLGLYGPVSVEPFSGNRLPYVDNLVNLVVAEDLGDVSMDEVVRVLAPPGVAYVRQGQGWTKSVKLWPEDIDEWTHYLHGPDNNAVGRDTVVGPPRCFQWESEPRAARHHDKFASISSVVTAGGRLFMIVDEAPAASIRFPARWSLVARDAFSGVLLWKQPITKWESHLRAFRSGPAWLPRLLVADRDRVYVTLGFGAPVTAHDAATGELVRTYPGTETVKEFVLSDGLLYVLTRDRANCAITALDAATGEQLWQHDGPELSVHASTLAAGRVVAARVGGHVVAWEPKTGRELWRAEVGGGSRANTGESYAVETLVVTDKVVLSTPGKADLIALSTADGKQLWTAPTSPGFHSPPDVFVAGGLVWTGTGRGKYEVVEGRDLLTGEVKRRHDGSAIYKNPGMAHPRCYRNKATERFLILGMAGVELLDVESGESDVNHWIRGVCQYGVVPSGGLLYVPPHACGCYLDGKLNGFFALAPARDDGGGGRGEEGGGRGKEGGGNSDEGGDARLERCPAYSSLPTPRSPLPTSSDWPTYRHDVARSGRTASTVATDLRVQWQTKVEGRPSAPVVAGGKLFVAVPDTHAVLALDAESGQEVWQFTAGGRVDSPPTIWQGRAIFGCADGWVYCLRASDGALAWRFRVAPHERRAVAHEQLESVWPVSGSVLVRDGEIWCAAGRSSYLDGGIRLLRLDAATGRLLTETPICSLDPETGKEPLLRDPRIREATLADILSSDGEHVFLRHRCFDLECQPAKARAPHLLSPMGFLNDTWWHRGYWVWSPTFTTGFTGYGSWPGPGNQHPAGEILVCDETSVYGYSRRVFGNQWPLDGGNKDATGGQEYHLFATLKNPHPAAKPNASSAAGGTGANRAARRKRKAGTPGYAFTWSAAVPLKVRAMVLAGDVLFAAGPPDPGPSDPDPLGTWEGKRGAVLAAFSAQDGNLLAQWNLDALPVFDGMAAAHGNLYTATAGGMVFCHGENK